MVFNRYGPKSQPPQGPPIQAGGYGAQAAGTASRDVRATAGIPIEEGDTLFLFVRNSMSSPVPVLVVAELYNPRTDLSTPFTHSFTPTVSTWAQEVSQSPQLPAGTILTNVVAITQGQATKSMLWAAVELFRGGQTIAFLCSGELGPSQVPSWPRGTERDSLSDISVQGRLFSLVVSQVNDGANAGNHVYAITAGGSGRIIPLTMILTNGDAAARAASLVVDDGAGNNFVSQFGAVTALAAGASIAYPYLGSIAQNGGNQMNWGSAQIQVAGANRIVGTVAAVAVTENTAFLATFLVWGPAPIVTMTGPTGSTPTTTVSRFENG